MLSCIQSWATVNLLMRKPSGIKSDLLQGRWMLYGFDDDNWIDNWIDYQSLEPSISTGWKYEITAGIVNRDDIIGTIWMGTGRLHLEGKHSYTGSRSMHKLLGSSDRYFWRNLCTREKGTSHIFGGLGRVLTESVAIRWICNSNTLTRDSRCSWLLKLRRRMWSSGTASGSKTPSCSP